MEPENTLPIRKGENIFQIFIFGFNMLVISFLRVFPCKHDQDSDTLMGLRILLDDLPWNEDHKNERGGYIFDAIQHEQ